jgi:ribonuclease HI
LTPLSRSDSRQVGTKKRRLLWEHGEYIGRTTNNQAEYRALIRGLEKAKELGATEVRCHLDSELIVRQLNREYKVRDKDLAPLFVKAWNLAQGFKRVTFVHIPRSKNRRADALVNHALDRQVNL